MQTGTDRTLCLWVSLDADWSVNDILASDFGGVGLWFLLRILLFSLSYCMQIIIISHWKID